jgi:putative tryptophan/tyrosine transport system substrate-binding protein
MRRRDFFKVISGSTIAWPLAALAQQPTMPVIGFLNSASPETYAPQLAGFRQGLNEVGYIEGQNVAIEFRWAKSQYNRLPELAADLVRRRVAVIAATGGSVSGIAAKSATALPPLLGSVFKPAQLELIRERITQVSASNFDDLLYVALIKVRILR